MVAVQHLTSISVLLEGVDCLCTFLSPESTCLLAIPSSSKFSFYTHNISLLVMYVFWNTPSTADILCLFSNGLWELELQNVLRHGDKSAGK